MFVVSVGRLKEKVLCCVMKQENGREQTRTEHEHCLIYLFTITKYTVGMLCYDSLTMDPKSLGYMSPKQWTNS